MKPKPKKRKNRKRQKKTSKQSNSVIEVGGKIILEDQENNQIRIVSNKNYNQFWGVVMIAFGFFLPFFLFSSGSNKINWFSVLFSLVLFLLFALMGLAYLRKAKSTETLIFDLDERLFKFSKTKAISFDKIDRFSVSELETALDHSSSHQLNIVFKNGKVVMLFTSDKLVQINDACVFLLTKTGIYMSADLPNGVKD